MAVVLDTHSNKPVGAWNELIVPVAVDLAAGGEHMEVEVIN